MKTPTRPDVSQESGMFRQQGFTLIEMLVVVAILAVLIALISSSIGKALDRGRQVSCMSNLKQIHAAFLGYANENGGRLPPVCNIHDGWRIWAYYLIPYSGEEQLKEYGPERSSTWPPNSQAPKSIFVCPSFSKEHPGSGYERNILGGYGMNRRLPPNETTDEDLGNSIPGFDWGAQYSGRGFLPSIQDPAERVLVACGRGGNGDLETYWQASNPDHASFSKNRHNGGSNILYVGGNVSFMRASDILLRASNELASRQSSSPTYPMLFRSGK